VYIRAADAAPDGWIKLQGKAVTVPTYNPPGSTKVVNINHTNFLRTFDLLTLNSPAITALHAAKLPGGVPRAEAGRSLTTVEREPVRRYALSFEVRDSQGTALPGDTLSAVILDNSPVIAALNLQELLASACQPLAGLTEVHLLYTLDHPHLRSFSISIANNSGVRHSPPETPSGAFAPGAFFFRGGDGAAAVDVTGDPPCAYAVTLSWQTRRYHDGGQSTQILYCK
jgi:hypothetical protein